MNESTSPENSADAGGAESKRDYGCEIISVVALLSLSALSHFWLLAIAVGALLAVWGFIVLMLWAWSFAALRMEFRRTAPTMSPSAPQVFLPEKIRPSVDC